MTQVTAERSPLTIGLDVGDTYTHFCVLDPERKVLHRGKFKTRLGELRSALKRWRGALVVLEAGSQSPWMSRALAAEGYTVHVADPRRVQLLSKDPRKSDRRDAETLARFGCLGPELIGQVFHRGEQAQADLSIVRSRDLTVRLRASIVQQIRSLSKAFGCRLPDASTRAFPKKVRQLVPAILLPAVNPLLEMLESLTKTIKHYDQELAAIARKRYRETEGLQKVSGVGPVTAITYVLTIEDPSRFATSRRVGSWLGLCPRSRASGDNDPDLPITKAGDPYLRRLLVQCAHCLLSRGKDCDLKRFGERLLRRGGGRGARRKVIIAIARKLAVLLHALLRSGADYDPDYLLRRAKAV